MSNLSAGERARFRGALLMAWGDRAEPLQEIESIAEALPDGQTVAILTLMPTTAAPHESRVDAPDLQRPTGGGGACALAVLDALDQAGSRGLHFSEIHDEIGRDFGERTITENLKRLAVSGVVTQPKKRGAYVHFRHQN